MAINLFKSYAYLIRLAQDGCYSLADIKEKWANASFNDEGKPLTTRTFHNYQNAILDIFNINIQYNTKRGVYEIADSDSEATYEERQYKDLLLNTFAIFSSGIGNPNLSQRILLGTNPFGCKYIPVIVSAIENNQTLLITIHESHKPIRLSAEYEFEPYMVKNFERYWILWGRNCSTGLVQTINVYDIDSIKETSKKFEYKDFHNDGWMNGWLNGLENNADKMLTIQIKVYGRGQISSVTNFPIWENQKYIESGETRNMIWDNYGENIDYAVFEYNVPEDAIIFFFNKIFQEMDFIQILSPYYLKDGFFEYINKVSDMLKRVTDSYNSAL